MATIDGKKAATAAEKAKYEKEQVQRVALQWSTPCCDVVPRCLQDARILQQIAQEEAALEADRAKQVPAHPCTRAEVFSASLSI